ncbi:MAG: lysophospholipid acyltransferase family protein [Jaaginema sp. PMC 1079.18]|nr:lysophospholipid acyltransferase family protein [Jaaginema sp. PMC 1080.18]MEC4853039.1 lysophospholipid acyltransferase family protein [Jaaginema sp. PMC 1079.18]MEC4865640.1 lysophospholipid acyltransferase family protein [Jaaginema sp. PMC 1078.18]
MATVERQREPRHNLVLYHLLKWSAVSPLLHTYFRGRIYGVENVPQTQPVIVVSNHASNFDPPIVANCVGRPVAFMAKQELFEVPVLQRVIRWYGAYPVKRNKGDRAAIRATLKALESGWAVGMFIQGTRREDEQITNPKIGAALIAAKAQVPLIPVSLWGTAGIEKNTTIPRPVPVTIRIGEAIAPPHSTERDRLEQVTQHCAEVINQMHSLGR